MVPVTGMEMVLARAHSHPKPAQGWRDWANGWKIRAWESVDSFSRQRGKLARKNPMTAAATLVVSLAAFRNPSVALSRLQQGLTFLPRRGMQGITALFRISPLGTLMVGGPLGVRLCQVTRLLIHNPHYRCGFYKQMWADPWLLSTEVSDMRHVLMTRLFPELGDITVYKQLFGQYKQLWEQQVIDNMPAEFPSTWSHVREFFDIRLALYRDIREKVKSDGLGVLDNYMPSEPLAEKIRQYTKCCNDYIKPGKLAEAITEAKLKSPYARKLLDCKTKEEFNRMRYQFSREAHPDKTRNRDDEQQKWINLVVEHICQEKNW
jgi:hypothetical protein